MAQTNDDVVDMTSSSAQLKSDGEVLSRAKKEAAVKKQTPSNNQLEKLQVTGSYVRRIDMEGPTPLVVWDQEDFDVAGVNTVSDYMRESPLFQASEDSGNRDGYFRFRGQHAGSTLILINGMRVPTLGGPSRGFYAGVENIPTNIIERVEILKDGSSALYGSDAMAGVMNFITKKDYDGADFSTRLTTPESGFGLEQNHTIGFGKSYSKGSWFVSSQFVEQRGYTEADIGNFFNVPTVGPSSNGNVTFFGGDSREEQLNVGRCPPNSDNCRIDTTGLDFVRDPRQNIGNMITGRYEVTPDINVSFLGMYNRRQRSTTGLPFRVNHDRRNGFAPLNASQLGGLGANSADHPNAEVSITAFDEIGARQINVLQNSYSAQTQIEGFIGDSWRWDVSGSYAYSVEDRDHRNGLIDQNQIPGLIAQGGWDPVNLQSPGNVGAFQDIGVRGSEVYTANQTMARFVTSGELFDLSRIYSRGGAVALAMGLEGQWQDMGTDHDPILMGGNLNQIFEPQTGSRAVGSVFTELVMNPTESLELQLAGRMDRYSDWGETFNPKVSLGYRPSNKVLIRSSWGTNFNAPALQDMNAIDRQGFERFRLAPPGTDPDSVTSQFIPVTRYRDENLRPEIGVNYNLGTIIQPNKRWTFSIDQWNFEGQDSIAFLSSNLYSDLSQVIGIEGLEASGVSFQTDGDGNVISARAPQVTNTGTKTIRGVDLGVRFDSPVRLLGKVLKMGLSMDHSHIMVNNDRRTIVAPIVNGEDLEWQNTLRFSLRTNQHSYQVAARTLAGNTTRTFRGVTRTHTEYDFNYNFNLPWSGRFSFGVKNLLNSPTPVDFRGDFIDYTASFNAYAFLPIGRRYYVGYGHTF
jgi:iron complex outermembrane recepter protein